MPRRGLRRVAEEQDEEVIVVSDDEEAVVVEEEDAVLPTQLLAASAPAAAAAAPDQAPSDAAARAAAGSGDAEAGSTCSICLDLLYEQGEHRPAALKCGHIFGNQCLRQWLQHQPRCPQCNKKAKARDITLLYNLPGVATGPGAAELAAQLQQERERSSRLQAQLQEMQRQVAVNKQQPAAAGACAAAAVASGGMGVPGPWQQLCQQHTAQMHAMAYQQHLQQQQYLQQQQQQQHPCQQQYRQGLPAAGSGPVLLWRLQQSQLPVLLQQRFEAAGPTALQGQRQLWQQIVGQKRPWEQAAAMAPAVAAAASAEQHFQQQQQQQQQQQPPQRRHPAAAAPADGASTAPAAAAAACAAAVNILAATAAAPAPAAEAQAGSSSGSSKRLLALLPYTHSTAYAAVDAAAGLQQQQQQQRWQQRQLAGTFTDLQQFNLEGSRCFHLDVPGALLLVGERQAQQGGSKLRKISLVCPASPVYIQLPSAGVVRALAAQKDAGLGGSSYGSQLVAVATERAGLQLVSMATNNAVQSVPVPGPVWSAAWSPQHEHQLLMGLDKGRLAVADLRKSGTEMLLQLSSSGGIMPQQPLHSLVALHGWHLDGLLHAQQGGSACSKWQGARPEALVACAGGVLSWGRDCPDGCFSQLLDSSWHGGTCEGIALAPNGTTLAASFRAPMSFSSSSSSSSSSMAAAGLAAAGGARGAPVHVLARLGVMEAPVAAATAGGEAAGSNQSPATSSAAEAMQSSQGARPAVAGDVGVADALRAGWQQLLQETLLLGGHSSSVVMTHGCFMTQLPGLQDETMLFVSADEQSRTPRLWGCSSGIELRPRTPFLPMPSAVLQVAGGASPSLGALLLGAMCERALVLYNWTPEC